MHKVPLADTIAQSVLNVYEKLPKKGKPAPDVKKGEWTVLSGFVVQNDCDSLSVVALGTGTKCLGQNETSLAGDLVHDSHAEVIAKRALVIFLMAEATDLLAKGCSKYLEFGDGGKFVRLKSGYKLHFYTSHPPCGDATIVPKVDKSEPKKARLDVHRTGAKSGLDARGEGRHYHTLGVVRTKPGRGDPTGSWSCSDKVAKWCQVGVQGALLALVFEAPLLPHSVVVGSDQFSHKAADRALFGRFGRLPTNGIEICHTDMEFPHGKRGEAESGKGCDASVFYTGSGLHGVVVDGRKQGCVKKHFGTAKAMSPLCRKLVAKRFVDMLANYEPAKEILCRRDFDQDVDPDELKAVCKKNSPFYRDCEKTIRPYLAKDPRVEGSQLRGGNATTGETTEDFCLNQNNV